MNKIFDIIFAYCLDNLMIDIGKHDLPHHFQLQYIYLIIKQKSFSNARNVSFIEKKLAISHNI